MIPFCMNNGRVVHWPWPDKSFIQNKFMIQAMLHTAAAMETLQRNPDYWTPFDNQLYLWMEENSDA